MPEQSSHAGRNVAVVAGAAFIIAVGVFVLFWKYHPGISNAPAAPQTNVQQITQPTTPEEKQQVLESAQVPQATSTPETPAEHQQILQNAQSPQQASSSSSTSLSQEEKMKLLQGGQ